MEELDGLAIPTRSELRKQMHDASLLLSAVRSTVADLLTVVAGGGTAELGALLVKQNELETALKRAFDVELKYHDWCVRKADDLAPGDIDFDAIRHQIGCRLSRLRECCDPG